MSVAEAASVVSVLCTGLFAGIMLTFMVVIRRALAVTAAPEYTLLWQRVTRAIDVPPTAPVLVLGAVAAPIVTLVATSTSAAAFALSLTGCLLVTLGVLGPTLVVNAPINAAFARASPERPPPSWSRLRDRWNAWSWVRFASIVAAFVVHVLALRDLAAG